MRVALFIDAYEPLVDGSITFLRNFHRTLNQMGHTSTVVVPHHPDYQGNDPNVISLPSVSAPFGPPRYRLSHAGPGDVERRLASRTFDVVHIHSPFSVGQLGVGFARRHHLPVLMTYHTLYPEYAYHYGPKGLKRFSRWLIGRGTRRLCNRCDGVIATSAPMVEFIQRQGVTRPIHVIPGGIRVDIFSAPNSSTDLKERLGIPSSDRILLYVGRLGHEKSVDFLIHVLERVRQTQAAHLVLCGDGRAKNDLVRLADQLQLTPYVHFVGFVTDPRELAKYYAGSDAFVFGSETDTQGLVLLEAMAAGLPVVAVNKLGSSGTIDHEVTGLLAPPVVESFSRNVRRVLFDSSLAKRLQEAGRHQANLYSFDLVTQRILLLYQEMLRQHGAFYRKDLGVHQERVNEGGAGPSLGKLVLGIGRLWRGWFQKTTRSIE